VGGGFGTGGLWGEQRGWGGCVIGGGGPYTPSLAEFVVRTTRGGEKALCRAGKKRKNAIVISAGEG